MRQTCRLDLDQRPELVAWAQTLVLLYNVL
jgi:hypothetical protein